MRPVSRCDYTILLRDQVQEGDSVFKQTKIKQFIDQMKLNNPGLKSVELIYEGLTY